MNRATPLYQSTYYTPLDFDLNPYENKALNETEITIHKSNLLEPLKTELSKKSF